VALAFFSICCIWVFQLSFWWILTRNVSSTAKVCLFADDCVLYRDKTSPSDAHQLPNRSGWEKDWQMEFHPQKCQILHITNKRTPIRVPSSRSVWELMCVGGWCFISIKDTIVCEQTYFSSWWHISSRSLMKSRNKRGPSTLPCGTPDETGAVFEVQPPKTTLWSLPFKKSIAWRLTEIDLNALPEKHLDYSNNI
jgi:hypothetical protein